MAKKHKNPLKDGNPSNTSKSNEGNSDTVFKTLFGEIPEQNLASNSLFSDNNPFRRKVIESRGPNDESGLVVSEKKTKQEGDSDIPEKQKQGKRKKDEEEKEQSTDLDTKLVAAKSKKIKAIKLKEDEINDSGSIETLEKEKKKKKKRKRDEVEAEYEAKLYGVEDVVEENKGGQISVLGEKRKKMDNPEDMMVSKEGFDDETKLLRTIFVGNIPLKLKKKEIIKEFSKFGEVESVRIRSVPIIDGKIPRKGAVIKRQINENGDSVHAYIVFTTEESAQSSLAHNMALVGGNHIRVDRACPPRKKLKGGDSPLYDNKRTIFVGNLPFDVKDEEIYNLFSGIKNLETSIEAVRVIRDPGSSLGKGIGYVLFKTMDAVNLILKKHNLRIRDRELRLSRAKSESSTPAKRKSFSQPETNTPAKKLDGASRMKPTTDVSYQGLRATKSGSHKKVHSKITSTPKSVSKAAPEQSSRIKKRPAVAARKEKTLKAAAAAANTTQVAGKKRKHGNRTPEKGQKKKARKLR